MTQRPDWFDDELFPFESRSLEIDGSVVHYVDEGEGVPLLMLHGNPTWSFLYRKLITGLSDTFRCIALDYPGFGLSTAPSGYTHTAAEHSAVVEGFVDQLGLDNIVLVAQDWGGPIGLSVATRQPDRFRAFVIGNTWAWPFGDDRRINRFSSAMGGDRSGELLSQRLNVFVNVFLKHGMRRRKPTEAEMAMWRGPFPTVESRLPVRVFPREIVSAMSFLEEVESGLDRIADRPALLFHADKDVAFGWRELKRWESVFSNHRPYILEGAGHYWQDDAGNEAVLAIRDWWSSIDG